MQQASFVLKNMPGKERLKPSGHQKYGVSTAYMLEVFHIYVHHLHLVPFNRHWLIFFFFFY